MLEAMPYLALGLSLAAVAGLIIVFYIWTHPDEQALRERARRFRLRHPRT